MGNPVQVYELSEILVYRDEDSVLRSRSLQQRPIPGIRTEGLRFKDIVPVVA